MNDLCRVKFISAVWQKAYIQQTKGSGLDNTTVMACVSAAGKALPPFIIYKGANLWTTWKGDNDIPGTFYAASEIGWMTSAIVQEWFVKFCEKVPYTFTSMMAKLIYENKLTHSDLSTSRLRKLYKESFNHKYNTAAKIMNSNYSSTDDTSLIYKNITLRESRLHQDDDVTAKVNKFSNLKTTSSERAISQHRKACDYLLGKPQSKRTCLRKYDVPSVSEEQSYVYLKRIDNVMLQENKNKNKTLRIRPHQSYDFGQKLNKGYLHLNKSNPNTSLHQSPHVGWPSTHSMSRYNSPTARLRRLSSAPQRYNPASYSSIKSSRGSTISHHSRHNPNSSKVQKPQKCFSPQTNRADFLFSIGLQSSVPQILTAIVPPGTVPTDDHWRTLAPNNIPKLDISAEKLFKMAGRLKVKLSEPSSSSKCWYRTGHLILSLLSNYSGLQDTQKRQLAHCTKQLLSDVEHGRSCAFANQFPSWLLFSPSLEKQRSKVRRKNSLTPTIHPATTMLWRRFRRHGPHDPSWYFSPAELRSST
uniref:(California timema) hypothetical protein n=1 Tax=Timema californicum TaxID=61474 RepID=A0A7R9J9Z7_TIMCA|nr:unnamed protein product [Timema californicum]